MIIWIFLNL